MPRFLNDTASDALVLNANGEPVDVDGNLLVHYGSLPFSTRYAIARLIVEGERACPGRQRPDNVERARYEIGRIHERYGSADLERLRSRGMADLERLDIMSVARNSEGRRIVDAAGQVVVTLNLTRLYRIVVAPDLPLS